MDFIGNIFGAGKDLNILQMSARGIVIFVISLVLIRISGRRSFGLHTPLDNIIAITLGAVLSRAVVGVSPFLPVICTCLVIVLLHRLFSWLAIHNKKLKHIAEGKKILLYRNGQFLKMNMDKALVGEEDIMQGVRSSALVDDTAKIEAIYMERNGEISVIKKEC